MIKEIEMMKEKIQNNIDKYKDFEIWAFYYLVKDIDIVEEDIKDTHKTLKELKEMSAANEIIELFELEVEKLIEVQEITNQYKEMLEPTQVLKNKISELQYKAYKIIKQCGFNRLARIEVAVDMRESENVKGYYITGHNKIFIHKETLENYTDDRIIEVLLHEYVHAWIDIYFSRIDIYSNSDDSIIFGCMVARLNKKVHRLGYNYKVHQNGYREAYMLCYYGKEFRALSDCRKKESTIFCEIIDMIDLFNKEYGTIKVLDGEGFKIAFDKRFKMAS